MNRGRIGGYIVFTGNRATVIADEAVQPLLAPALPLCFKRELLGILEFGNVATIVGEKSLIIAIGELRLLDPQRIATMGKGGARLQQFGIGYRIETDLIEKSEQPGLVKLPRFALAVPHLDCTPEQLV